MWTEFSYLMAIYIITALCTWCRSWQLELTPKNRSGNFRNVCSHIHKIMIIITLNFKAIVAMQTTWSQNIHHMENKHKQNKPNKKESATEGWIHEHTKANV